MFKNSIKAAMSLSLVFTFQTAFSEETIDESAYIEEVVVTAQKREESSQDVPASLSAFTASDLENQVIRDASDITMTTPNVRVVQSPNNSTSATATIRGSSSINPAITWEPAVGIYVDGVFIAKNTGGLFDVANLERIEVLKGPQGTLYGKNTTGGAINLVTKPAAEEFGGKVKVGSGNYGFEEKSFNIDTGRFGDVAAFNLAYSKKDRDGFYKNKSLDNPDAPEKLKSLDTEAARVNANFNVLNVVEIDYAADYFKADNTSAFGQLEVPPGLLSGDFEIEDPDRADEASVNGAGKELSESWGQNLTISADITDDINFKSITAMRKLNWSDATDIDGSDTSAAATQAAVDAAELIPLPPATLAAIAGSYQHAERDVESDQVSQEFQLTGRVDIVDYIVGAFYFEEDSQTSNPFIAYLDTGFATVPFDGVYTIPTSYGVESKSYAVYSQVDIHPIEALSITGGLRFNKEKKDAFSNKPFVYGLVEADDSWSNVSWVAALTWHISEDINMYFREATGWKSGGFNGEAASAAAAAKSYDEETQLTSELGLKTRLWGGRIQTNVALFYNQIDDLQVSTYDPVLQASVVSNAAEATLSGFEVEFILSPIREVSIFFNYGYLDAKYDEFIDPVLGDITKTALFPYAPENTVSTGIELNFNIEVADLMARIDFAYTDEQDFYYDPGYASQTTHSDDYVLLNARLSLEFWKGDETSLEVGFWGKNLTDEEYRQNGFPGTLGGINYYGDPRTSGIDLTVNF